MLKKENREYIVHFLFYKLQVAQWKHLDLNCVNVLEWGWKMGEEIIEPIKTDEEPAPEEMIAYVRCKCDPTLQKTCNSRSCSCFKYGLKCVDACKKCHGVSCNNSEYIEIADDNEIERNIFDLFETI